MNKNNFGIDLSRLEVFGEKYLLEITILLEKLNATNNPRSHCLHIKEFAKKFTILPKLWEHWNLTEKDLTLKEFDSFKYKHFRSFEKFCNSVKYFYMNFSYYNFLYYETDEQMFKRMKSLKEGLFYPHQDLDKLYEMYDRNSSYALSQKELNQYKTALNLYKKLKASINNNDEWFKGLKETNDSEYIINTCEYRLSVDPYNVTFWESYLSLLKTVDTTMMFKTYSRYCRLFLYDYSKVDEYYNEIIYAEIPCKAEWWMDYISLYRTIKSCEETNEKMVEILFAFYCIPEDWTFSTHYFEDKLKEFTEIIKSKETHFGNMLESNKKTPLICPFKNIEQKILIPKNLTHLIRQRYPFKSTIMRYILDYASPQLLQKLQMACKELYLQKPILYCQRLCIEKSYQTIFGQYYRKPPIFFENALIVSSYDLQYLNLENYHLVNSLEIREKITIPYFRKCTVKYLTIHKQTITENEMEFLTSKVEFLEFLKVSVTKNDETDAPIDYIIEKLSHVPNIKLNDPMKTSFTEATAQNLAALKWDQKFKSFHLNQLPVNFNVENLCKFVKENAAKDAELKFNYDSSIDKALKYQRGQILKNKLQKISKQFKFL
uniref:Uncharacterized protein n=1 Tax=Panagrolaimus sp. PS1159 TaxID=55785 RepID=A0AC35FSC1_9BILA